MGEHGDDRDDHPPPRVSVLVTTYNHEAFIGEALDRVVDQQLDEAFEIVVTDDASRDRTADVVADFQRRHPELVRAAFQEVNEGPNRTFRRTLARCRGEYIALLDGDDLWIARDKLQRQVDLLDADPSCSMVFSPAEVFGEGVRRRVWYPPHRRPRYELDALMRGNFIATSSAMFRRSDQVTFPAWFDESQGMPADWVFFCRTARLGSIAYIDRPLSAYRLHEGGIWSSSSRKRVERLRASIDTCRRLNDDFGGEYGASTRHAIRMMRMKIAIQSTVPFIVNPLISLRGSISEAVARVRG